MDVSSPSSVIKTSIFKQILKIFSPMAINVHRISLINEKLHFLHYFVRGAIYALIDVFLVNFSVILQPRKFCKVEFTYICSSRETTRKITKILQPFGF